MAMTPKGAHGLHVMRGRSHSSNHANIWRILREHPDLIGLVAFDEFAQTIVLKRPFPMSTARSIRTSRNGCGATTTRPRFAASSIRRASRKPPAGVVRDVVVLEAREHAFHPVRDYLSGLVWDGVHRMGRLFLDHCGVAIPADPVEAANMTAYVEAVTRCFFIGAVARVMAPGCKVDTMPVLEGVQGTLKSKLLRTIAVHDDWFSDSLPHSLDGKDARQHLAGKWIIELSELSQFRGSSVETLKSFLSCQVDKYRPPYGRNDVSVPRQCVFVGSTNARTYLHDPSGGRRFWPIRFTRINVTAIQKLVPQLWAEAVAAWKDGDEWWLTPKMEKIAAEQQAGRLERDSWHEPVVDFVEGKRADQFFTISEIFDKLGVVAKERRKGDENRIGSVLNELGCQHVRRYYPPGSGNQKWGWVKS